MSHEIRTPLSIISGILELLGGSDLDREQLRKVRTATQASRSLLNILNDILDLSKIEAGKVEYQLVPLSVHQLVRTNAMLFEKECLDNGIDLLFEQDDSIPPRLLGDPDRIGQVVRNLVGNAVKFTESGYVKVSTELASESEDSACVRVSVEDTGPGIDRDVLPRLFVPFSQGQEGRKKGTGLGLSISRMLVEDMGGSIHAESESGSGSMFTFELHMCISREGSGSMETGVEEDSSDRRGMRILLVDDNPSIREIAEAFLVSFGCSVTQASDGQAAVDACSEELFDLILMDVQMPCMTGPEATSALREKGISTPVVALTGHAMANQQEGYFSSGMNHVLAKPFFRDDLQRVLQKWSAGALGDPPGGSIS